MSRRRILIVFLAFLASLTIGGYVVLHQTGAVRSFVRDLIGDRIREDLFRMDDAEIDLTAGTVTVKRFRIENPDLDAGGSPLLSVDTIQVEVETNPLGEVGAVRHVGLDGLTINVSLAEGGMPELSKILKVAGVETTEGGPALPSISAVNSIVHLRVAPERPIVTFSNLALQLQPGIADPDELTLRGTMVSPLGHVITIRGAGNASTRQFRTLLTMEDVPIKPEQAAAFQSEAAEFLDTAEVKGIVKQATLWMDLHQEPVAGSSQTRPVFLAGLNAELAELSAAPRLFPYRFIGASGRLHATIANGGAIKFRVENKAVDGDMIATGRITRCLTDTPEVDLQLTVQDLLIGPRLRAAFENTPVEFARKFHAAVAPSAGRVSARIRVGNGDGSGELTATGDFTLDGVSATFHGFREESGQRVGFPYPLHGVTGTISLRPDAIIFDRIAGADTDGARVTVDGEIATSGDTARPNLDITGTNLRFSPQLRECLGVVLPGGEQIWDEYEPRGHTDLTVRLRDSGRGPQVTVDLAPRDASAAYAAFPYRVHKLGGLVKIGEEGVWIDLHGRNGATPLSVNGRFRFDAGAGSSGVGSELWVKATDAPLDEDLRRAAGTFLPELEELWELSRPTGTIGCELTMWRESADEPFSYDVHFEVVKGDAAPRDLPILVRNVTGNAYIHGTGEVFRCDISPIRSEIGNGPDESTAKLITQGTLHCDGTGFATDLTTIVRRLRLSEPLGKSLGAAGFATGAIWDALKLDGFVDIIAHHRKRSDEARAEPDVHVRLRDVRSNCSVIPGAAHDLHGEVVIDGTGAHFALIEGAIDRTKVTLRDGRLDLDGAVPELRFLIDSESFPVDQRLGCLMTGPTKEAFATSKMSGRVGFAGFAVRARFGDAPRIDVDGKVNVHDLFIDGGLPGSLSIQHLTGSATLVGTVDGSGGQLSGSLQNVGFELGSQRFSAIAAQFDVNQERLLLKSLRFNVGGGLVEGNGPDQLSLRYDFTRQGVLQAYLAYRQVSLNALLRDQGLAHSSVRGLLGGTVTIEELAGTNLLDMRAKGEVSISNGRLGRVPIFSALYSHIAEDKRPQFRQASAKFVIGDQRIRLDEIRARSQEIHVEGEGTIAMDGYMDVQLRLPGVFGSAADLLILPPLIDLAVSKVVQFQLYGYIREPKLSWTFNKKAGRTALSPIGPEPAAGPPSER